MLDAVELSLGLEGRFQQGRVVVLLFQVRTRGVRVEGAVQPARVAVLEPVEAVGVEGGDVVSELEEAAPAGVLQPLVGGAVLLGGFAPAGMQVQGVKAVAEVVDALGLRTHGKRGLPCPISRLSHVSHTRYPLSWLVVYL